MKKFYTLLAAVVTTATFAQTNLVSNGGFEVWTSDTEPENFAPFTNGSLSVNNFLQKEATIKKSGEFSARHTSQSSTQTIGGDLIPVEGGTTYVISYWYLDNDNKARTRIWSNWRNETEDLTDNADVLKPNEYSTDNSEWQKVEFTLVAPANATHFRLQARTYREAVGQEGGFIYYDDFSMVENDPTSIKQDNIDGLAIYPNPANDVINITSNGIGVKAVTIFDLVGKKVIETSTNQTINVSSLKAGIYLVNIKQDGKSATRKLVIK